MKPSSARTLLRAGCDPETSSRTPMQTSTAPKRLTRGETDI